MRLRNEPLFQGITLPLDGTIKLTAYADDVNLYVTQSSDINIINSILSTYQSVSTTAEYAAPVWERSAYAHLLNPELNQACRAITGCLRPTNVETCTCSRELPLLKSEEVYVQE